MNLGFKIVAAWLGATLVAVVIASAAVGSVRSQVTEEALPLGSPDVAALAVGVTSGSDITVAPSIDLTTTTRITPPGTSTSTTSGSLTVTTTSPTGGSSTTSTSTASAPSATTTTVTPPGQYSRTFDTAGGSVRVVVEGNKVTFGGAVPKTGWSIELKNPGPEEVEVEFEQNGGKGDVGFSAKIEHGELKVEISGGGDDDH